MPSCDAQRQFTPGLLAPLDSILICWNHPIFEVWWEIFFITCPVMASPFLRSRLGISGRLEIPFFFKAPLRTRCRFGPEQIVWLMRLEFTKEKLLARLRAAALRRNGDVYPQLGSSWILMQLCFRMAQLDWVLSLEIRRGMWNLLALNGAWQRQITTSHRGPCPSFWPEIY